MRPLILTGIFALTVVAIPIAVELEQMKHLEKRGSTDTVIADVVKALIAFGAYVWGGGIIAKKAVNYYFDKKAKLEMDKEKRKNQTQLLNAAAVKKTQLPPAEQKKVSSEEKKPDGE